MNLSQSH